MILQVLPINVKSWILMPLLSFKIREEFIFKLLSCCLQGVTLINTLQGSGHHDS